MSQLDLSHFKKVSSDKKSTVLRHSGGHEIKIAHSGLTPEMRKEFDKLPTHMAEGGAPEDMDPESPAPAPEAAPAQAAPVAPAEDTPMRHSSTKVAGPDVQQAQPPGMAARLKAEDAAWQRDLANGHIHPKTYDDLFAKKDTLGKIGSYFGLLMSGAGSGLAHQPNAVMEMMDKEIQNDLDAQRTSKTNAQNMLRLNQEHLFQGAQIDKMVKEGALSEAQAGKLKAETAAQADATAHMKLNRIGLHSLVVRMQKLPKGSPLRIAAEQQLALMMQGVQAENYNIADRAEAASALSGLALGPATPEAPPAAPTAPGGGTEPAKEGGGGDEEKTFQNRLNVMRASSNPTLVAMADTLEQRHIPGIEGQASMALSAGDRDAVRAGVTFQNQLKDFQSWTSKHSGDLSPTERNIGETKAKELQGLYRGATAGGVFKMGEQGFIESIIDPVPTKFFNDIRVLPQLATLKQSSSAQLDQRLKSFGFKGYKEKAGSHPDEGKVATNAKGEKLVMKGGKWVPVTSAQASK